VTLMLLAGPPPGRTGLRRIRKSRRSIVSASQIACVKKATHCAGLDARAAAIVMRTVRNTVNTGRTVVCTIHQPSIDIFEVCSATALSSHGAPRNSALLQQLCCLPNCICNDVARATLRCSETLVIGPKALLITRR